ncbi:MAG: hypothetical protein AB8F78_13785 [Saprospiraceae bacterium]
MKKWMWIPLVLIVTFVGDRLMAHLLTNAVDKSEFRYSRLYAGEGKADIVFLGNSRGLNFFQPYIEQATGKTTLNLSYNAMPADIGGVLLRDYMDAYGAPEKLVVDATFLDRDNEELVRDFRVYAQYSDRLDSLLKETDSSIYWGTKVAHLSRYGGEVAQRMFYYLSTSDEDWLLDRQISKQVVEASANLEPYRNNYTLDRVRAFGEVVKEFQDAGTEVHFVINPYYPAFQKTIMNLDSLALDVQKETGIQVLDYSKSVTGDQNFGDYQHLNKQGAEVYLGRLLKDIGL